MCSGQVMGKTMRKNSMVRENEYMQVDTLFSLSTNQVKQRTKEAETRVFKDSVGSNQGMRSMGNNPLILGKENMQTYISLSLSTEKVMKPSQTVEIGSFGKERGKGLTGSTMCSGQVMGITMRKNSMVSENEYMQVDTPFSPSTNQVKQRTKEDETRVFKNSVGSNQGMRSMGNNPLILGKENMQTNISLPPSTNIVMKPSQTVEIAVGSSNPKNVKIVRGSNKCKEVSSLEVGQKLKVTFYNNRTVRKNSNLFLRHLGKIIRDSNMCPLSVSSWSDIKKQNLDHMWAAIKDKFESDDMNDHRDHIFGWMNELWNKWRGDLHSKYVKNKSMIHALKCKPQRVESREEGLGVMLSLLFKNNTSKKQKEYSKPS
ncbi:uncharacterized protein LOC107847476 isoform X3 [Capsicum annuum]|uniref:uncharacterized protein LOC107847476 isoform X3 n=1 Tax=Capsicum annuum TaxID=4072 RepID=UPI001FB0C0E7|nr:uncharacterized protein LOC107847476 isoform X3 [Capsicum annuum]XP_047254781.1 uncharacterized protein LOC107847476 isoform X3 [Capsicum annuum]